MEYWHVTHWTHPNATEEKRNDKCECILVSTFACRQLLDENLHAKAAIIDATSHQIARAHVGFVCRYSVKKNLKLDSELNKMEH